MMGIEGLRARFATKRDRVQLRYKYYEQKALPGTHSPLMPPHLATLYRTTLGWCTKAVDFLADRLVVDGFDKDNFQIEAIYNQNNPDILFDSAILSALISSCCFIYISTDESGYPRLQVIDGANATGTIDPITNMLVEGYAVLSRNKDGVPETEAYFVTGSTSIYMNGKLVSVIQNDAPYPLLVPIINRPDAVRPFGHSRISRDCMAIQDDAARATENMKIAADFYSIPQKYVIGLAEDAEPLDSWRATYSAMLQFYKDEDGDKPQLGQFQQQSLEPLIAELRYHANKFAGATGLTMDDLGYASDNPSSAEAIKAAHESLRNTARKAQRDFSSGFVNAGYLAACVRDKYPYLRRQVYLTTVRWKPIIEPDAAMLSGIGDGAIKINQAVEGYFTKENLQDLTGIKAGGV